MIQLINSSISKILNTSTKSKTENFGGIFPLKLQQIEPIVIGALGYAPKCLEKYIQQLGFNKIETEKLVQKLQNLSASGIVKICKTFLSFHDSYNSSRNIHKLN